MLKRIAFSVILTFLSLLPLPFSGWTLEDASTQTAAPVPLASQRDAVTGCSTTSLDADCVLADLNDDTIADFKLRGLAFFENGIVIGTTPEPAAALHIEDGDIMLHSSEGTHLIFQRTGLKKQPKFAFGRITEAGIGEAELRFLFSDEETPETKVFGIEATGTIASVKRDYGSHFEGFIGGEREPLFRINSYPTTRLELGNGGDEAPDVIFRRNEEPGSFALTVGEIEKLTATEKETILNAGGNDIDFLIKGEGEETLLFADASEKRIGIHTTQPEAALHVKSLSPNQPALLVEGSNTRLRVDAQGDLILPTYMDAERPAPGKPGRIIYNSDDQNLNLDTGREWVRLDGKKA